MSRTVLKQWCFFLFSCISVGFLWLQALIGLGIWVANPDIKEFRSLVLAESTCMSNQPCALLDPLFSCNIIHWPVMLQFDSSTELLFNQVGAQFSERKYCQPFPGTWSSTLSIFCGFPGLSKVTTFCSDCFFFCFLQWLQQILMPRAVLPESVSTDFFKPEMETAQYDCDCGCVRANSANYPTSLTQSDTSLTKSSCYFRKPMAAPRCAFHSIHFCSITCPTSIIGELRLLCRGRHLQTRDHRLDGKNKKSHSDQISLRGPFFSMTGSFYRQ